MKNFHLPLPEPTYRFSVPRPSVRECPDNARARSNRFVA